MGGWCPVFFLFWRAEKKKKEKKVPRGHLKKRRQRALVWGMGCVWLWEGARLPSIFPRTRSTAPEHPEHIIATLSTTVVAIVYSLLFFLSFFFARRGYVCGEKARQGDGEAAVGDGVVKREERVSGGMNQGLWQQACKASREGDARDADEIDERERIGFAPLVVRCVVERSDHRGPPPPPGAWKKQKKKKTLAFFLTFCHLFQNSCCITFWRPHTQHTTATRGMLASYELRGGRGEFV